VHPRTVRRDIESLCDQFEAPIAFDARWNGHETRESTYRPPLLPFTEGERIAPFPGERLLRLYRGTSYGPDLARAFATAIFGLT
jgi:predicted DNA-binding transcriptional regulator YafY